MRIEGTIVSEQSQSYLLDTLAKLKDPATLSLVNVDADLSAADSKVKDDTTNQDDPLPIIKLL